MADLGEIISGFRTIDGVKGALVMDAQAILFSDGSAEWCDFEALAQVIKLSLGEGRAVAAALGRVPVERQLVEYAGMQIIAEELAGGQYLVLATSPGANLGRVRLAIRKSKSLIEAALG